MGMMQYGAPQGASRQPIYNEKGTALADGLTYMTLHPFVPGTLCVTRSGSRLAPGIHFQELATANGYKILDTNGNPQAANILMLADYLQA